MFDKLLENMLTSGEMNLQNLNIHQKYYFCLVVLPSRCLCLKCLLRNMATPFVPTRRCWLSASVISFPPSSTHSPPVQHWQKQWWRTPQAARHRYISSLTWRNSLKSLTWRSWEKSVLTTFSCEIAGESKWRTKNALGNTFWVVSHPWW